MKKIVLLCTTGLSTNLIIKKIQQAAIQQDYDCVIEAFPTTQAQLASKEADVLLLGPQVRFDVDRIQSLVDCPVAAIDVVDYGTMNGKNILALAISLIGESV